MRTILLLLIIFCCYNSMAQTPVWANRIGGTGTDWSYVCKIGSTGNVYVAGRFEGTMDMDPGTGVANVTSAGGVDIFLGCYTSSGGFLWGESIGGTGNEVGFNMALDQSDNVILTGWFQGPSVDMDPGPGVATLSGVCCGSGPSTGNGYVAKYTSTGAYMWGYALTGTLYPYSYTQAVEVDGNNNIYVGGIYRTSMYVSPSITLNEAATGTNYLIKYSPTGTVVWAHSFGNGSDGQTRGIKINGANMYITGFYCFNSDFYPWGSHYYLTASGYADMFVARYDTAGNFHWVRGITGSGGDELLDLKIDANDNLYVTGAARSTAVTFNSTVGSTTVTCPGGAANGDIVLAKYDSSGNFIWGHVMGGPGDDIGFGIDLNNGFLYNTGYFQNTVDFDPSGAVANFVSAGTYDAYVTKYDLNGNYICGFKIGSTADDKGYYGLTHDPSGYMYISGAFSGTNTDFDPGTGTTLLTSAGSTDAYFAKYDWTSTTTSISGSLTGDTVCAGSAAYLTLNITSGGAGPYTITISNGTTSTVYTGIIPGTPFLITPTPTTSTTYTVVSATTGSTGSCNSPTVSISGASILVGTGTTTISVVQPTCDSVRVTSSGTTSYSWTFGDGGTGTGNPIGHHYAGTGTYSITVHGIDTIGCATTGSVTVTVATPPVVNLGHDTTICNAPYTVASSVTYSGTVSYLWSTGSTSPAINVTASGTYWLRVTVNGCPATDTVHILVSPPIVINAGNDTSLCDEWTLTLTTPLVAGYSYIWNTGSVSNTASVGASGFYWVVVTNSYGCTAADTVHVVFSPPPVVNLGPDTTGCIGSSVTLYPHNTYTLPTYLWSTGATTPTISVSTSGTYWLQVSAGGCSSNDVVVVTLFPPLPLDLGMDTVLCDSPYSVMLSSVQPAGTSYLWSNGSTGDTLRATTTGLYWLQLDNGCKVSDTISIKIGRRPSATPFAEDHICAGDTTVISILNHSANAWDYTWGLAGAHNFSDTADHDGPYTVRWDTGGTYVISLAATSIEGCLSLPAYDTITVYPQPMAAISVSSVTTVRCMGDSALLTALNVNDSNTYSWYPSSFFADSNAHEVWANISHTGYVTLTVINYLGCKAVDSVLFLPDCCELVFPSAFTPNGDGKNDVWRPIGGNHKLNDLRIDNRWGETVFESKKAGTMVWDGTFNGVRQDMNVFYYYVRYECEGHMKLQKGEITLIR